jgi:GGDEF domain-containing protein
MDGRAVKPHSGQLSGRRKENIDQGNPRPRRARHLDADQSASGADQTSADTDQTSSDSDQSMADRDQAASEADQRVSDRDQAASDLEFGSHLSSEATRRQAHERAQADREEGTMARVATTAVRAQIGAERHEQARRRDEIARRRDEIALSRDQEAERMDEAAEELARKLGEDTAATRVAAVARASAAAARANAARDRERAAKDREAAERDRELMIGEIERTYMDEPTGAYGRQIGEVLLRHEFARVQSIEGTLTLGFVPIDEVTQIGQRHNGDATRADRDRDLFLALQSRLRPYDPIVRWSDDEFLCALADISQVDADVMLEAARADLSERHPSASAGMGVVSIETDETFDAMLERARGAI